MAKNTETPAKGGKRGRKPGTKSPRNIMVTCISGKDLCVEEIQVQGDKASNNDDLMAVAAKEFESKHGKRPLKVLTPHFSRCGQQVYQKRRDSVRIPVDQIVFTRDKGVAEYNGWEVAVHYIENHPEAAYVIFKRELAEGDKKKAKPPAKTVSISSLTNVRPVTEEETA